MSPGIKSEESLVLLLKAARLSCQHLPEAEVKAAVALIEDFGYLALAIVHAGAYIAHSPGLTISNYRKLFLSQRRRMLDEYNKLKVPVDDYTKTVYTTWEMCYSLLKQDTRYMLWLAAFLHHNAITEEIFERGPFPRVSLLPPSEIVTTASRHVEGYLRQFLDLTGEWNGLQFLSVINEAVSCSLIDFDRMNGTYNIHVLVQDWAKTKVEQSHELALESTATLLSLSIGFDDSLESKDFMVSLEMHLDHFLTNRQPPARDYHRQFAKAYRELKRWQQVEGLETNVYQEMNRALGERHMYTLGSMIDLASTYVALDRLDKAGELQMRALNIQKEWLGQDHPHTQRSITNLASIYLKQGRLNEAEKVQLQCLTSHSQLQPQRSRSSQEVIRLQSSTHNQQELISEREFLNMLRGKANLALVYSKRGRLVEAEALQNEILNAYQRKFTEEHSDTVASMLNLVSTYCQQNRWDESAKLCLQVVKLQTRILGETDSETVKSMAKLAMIYSKQGQWAKAETFQQHVVSSLEQTLGSEHLDTLDAMAKLAMIHCKQGNWAKSESLQQVVSSYQRNLGPEHVHTIGAMARLAGTGKRDVADPIRLGKGQVKGELHYTAEFIPALALQGINFEGVDDIQRAIDRAKGAHEDEDGFASGDESSVSSSDEEMQRVPMDITVNSKGHRVSSHKRVKSADTVRTAQTGQTAATDTEESELDDETPPEEHKGEGVQMTTEELLSQQSGVLVFNVMEGQIAKKARLEVLLDDGYWPVFATEKARSTHAHWDQVGEGFIKELDFGRVWLRLNEHDEGEKGGSLQGLSSTPSNS